MALNSWSSCLYILSSGIVGVYCHASFMQCWDQSQGFINTLSAELQPHLFESPSELAILFFSLSMCVCGMCIGVQACFCIFVGAYVWGLMCTWTYMHVKASNWCQDHPQLVFHLIHWGKFSQANPELPLRADPVTQHVPYCCLLRLDLQRD